MGKPVKQRNTKKTRFCILLTNEERVSLEIVARRRGLTPSSYFRMHLAEVSERIQNETIRPTAA